MRSPARCGEAGMGVGEGLFMGAYASAGSRDRER